MTRRIFLISVLFNISFLFVYAVRIKPSENVNAYDLKLICQTWGYLKYCHPNVSNGAVNWDEPLLTALRKLDSGRVNVTEALTGLITAAGPASKSSITFNEPLVQMVDFDWMQDNRISDTIRSALIAINAESKRQYKNNYYIKIYDKWIIDLMHEPEYEQEEIIANKNIRLLLAFRYWNIIEYYWPNKHLLQQSWDSILVYFIPKFIQCKTRQDFHLTMYNLSLSLNDVHGCFIMNDVICRTLYSTLGCNELSSVPLEYHIEDGKVFIDHSATDRDDQNKLLTASELVQFNGETPQEILNQIASYATFADYRQKERLLNMELSYANSDTASLLIRKKGKLQRLSLKLGSVINDNQVSLPYYKFGQISYLDVGAFAGGRRRNRSVLKELVTSDTIILDLRKYPDLTFGSALFDQLVGGKRSWKWKEDIPSLKPPGYIEQWEAEIRSNRSAQRFQGILVLLVNHNTVSLGEHLAWVFQRYERTITVGTSTGGAAGIALALRFPDNIFIGFTKTTSYKAENSKIEGEGINIDYIFSYQDQEGFDGKDFLLWKTLQVIRKK